MNENDKWDEMGKFYQEAERKFYKDIEKFAYKVFDNKICVVDESKCFLPSFELKLQEYMYNEEDFRNAQVSYITRKTSLSDNRKITIYQQTYKRGLRNEVQSFFAKTLSEFMNIILEVTPINKCKCVYRGHGNWIYDMVPGIYREQNKKILENESKYIREVIASNPKFFENCNSALDYLAVLQHHGFPTRLLDFTENPLVALYMACSSAEEEHGDVIRIDLSEQYYKYYDSDTISVLSNLAFFDDDIDVSNFQYQEYFNLFESLSGYTYNRCGKCMDEENRSKMIKKFNEREDIKRLVHKICSEKPYFTNEIDPQHLDNMILFVKPRQTFERITLQNGLFAVFGINQKKKDKVDFESYNLDFKITHIIIPDECKKSILKELDVLNINQGTLYGDMDNIVKDYIKKYNQI